MGVTFGIEAEKAYLEKLGRESMLGDMALIFVLIGAVANAN
jgi:hypothetical protein